MVWYLGGISFSQSGFIASAALMLGLLCSSASAMCSVMNPQSENQRQITKIPAPDTRANKITVAQGITYENLRLYESNIHILRIDLNEIEYWQITPESQRGKSSLEHATMNGATVAINGSFFDGYYNPRGHTVSNLQKWSKVLYAESSPFIACKANNVCSIDHEGQEDPDDLWVNAVGGQHSLITAGKVRSRSEERECGGFCNYRHPRTAIGLTKDQKTLIIILAEGRRSTSVGVRLFELARIFERENTYDAFNLDGGGSTTLVIDGQLKTALQSGKRNPRRVSNSLLFF